MMLIRNGQTDNGLIISSPLENLLPPVVAAVSKMSSMKTLPISCLAGKLQVYLRTPLRLYRTKFHQILISAGKAGADDDKEMNACKKKR